MGFSVPKLPIFKKVSAPKMFSTLPSPHSGFNRKPIVVRTKPDMVGTPIWAPREDNYLDVAYDMNLQDPKVIVVEYKAKPGFPYLSNFTRLYLVEKNGQPVPCMKDMWRELGKIFANQSSPPVYEIDSEGRLTHCKMIVKANEIWPILKEAIAMWGQWKNFPTINEFDTVRKLIEGQKAIDKFKSEESHSWIANQIKEAQETIKSAQEEIVKLEKSLNEIYEQAADAMNLFEENGIKADMDGDGEPEKDPSFDLGSSLDMASLYPSSISGGSHYFGLRFSGQASISTNSNGGVSVGFSTNPGNIEVGDMVIDPKSNKQAVYCGNNKWTLIQ